MRVRRLAPRRLGDIMRRMLSMAAAWFVCSGAVATAELPVNWSELPAPYLTPSAKNRPRVISRPRDAKITLPPGFLIEEYTRGVPGARYMTLGPGDEVWVSDMAGGSVHVVVDQKPRTIISGLDRPYGLAFWKGWLYVAEATSVKRYHYEDNSHKVRGQKVTGPTVTGKGQEVIPLHRFAAGHVTRTLLFDDKAAKLYLAIGSESNVGLGEDPMRAAISRFDPDGGAHEIVASGLRNPVGMRWHPATAKLWATSVERDGLGDDLPPDFLTEVEAGGFYGWPYAYIGPHEDPRHKGRAPEMVKKTRYPSVLLGPHVAALDFLFYAGTQFPERYRGGAFIALHGSWNRSRLAGYEIAFVPFDNGRPAAGPESFASGFAPDPAIAEVWGRPVGLLQLPDGSLLVSDDAGGLIWRIAYRTP